MTVDEMKLVELAPYIKGEKVFGEVKQLPRVDKETFDKFIDEIESDPAIYTAFNEIKQSAQFFRVVPELGAKFPTKLHTDLFYSAKLGALYTDVHGYLAYTVKLAYDKYKVANLISKLLPTGVLSKALSGAYTTPGVSLMLVIQNIADADYVPLTKTKLKVNYPSHSEIYLKDTDMVLCVPRGEIDKALVLSVIDQLESTGNDVSYKGRPIRSLFGYYGAVNSKYDLRKLV